MNRDLAIAHILDSLQTHATPYRNLEGYMVRERLNYPDVDVRLHTILRSDTDPFMHDHPWWSISVVLSGMYREVMPFSQSQDPFYDGTNYLTAVRKAGDIVFRQPTDRHLILLPDGPVVSLFITGPREQEWGFYTPAGKVPHHIYLNGS